MNTDKHKFFTNLRKCKTIFFDLEFYVPEQLRESNNFNYNPWDKHCKLIGGSFLVVSGYSSGNIDQNKLFKRIKSFWIWNFSSERQLIKKILIYLQRISNDVRQAHDGKISAVLCGIGITHSDVPILFELFKRYKLLTNAEAFVLQNQFRIIDLSQIATATLKNKSGFLYPVPKNGLTTKYLGGKLFEDGRNVWSLYETKDFNSINKRVNEEVLVTYECYKRIIQESRMLKDLEARHKREIKTEIKDVAHDEQKLGSKEI